jgi:hypothetical protein
MTMYRTFLYLCNLSLAQTRTKSFMICINAEFFLYLLFTPGTTPDANSNIYKFQC